MSHLYVDFSTADKGTIEKAVREAANVLGIAKSRLTKATFGNTTYIDPLEPTFIKWFAAYNAANVAVVLHKINAIHSAVTVGSLWIKSCTENEDIGPPGAPDLACPPGTNAEAQTSAGVLDFAASRTKAGYQNSIFICPRMLKGMAMRGIRRQNIGGTLIHELSHAIAGTDDVVQGGNSVYGAFAALHLAKFPAGATLSNGGGVATAMDNAENYGFFCMDLRQY